MCAEELNYPRIVNVPCLFVDQHSNFIMSEYVHILFWRYKACCQREKQSVFAGYKSNLSKEWGHVESLARQVQESFNLRRIAEDNGDSEKAGIAEDGRVGLQSG